MSTAVVDKEFVEASGVAGGGKEEGEGTVEGKEPVVATRGRWRRPNLSQATIASNNGDC